MNQLAAAGAFGPSELVTSVGGKGGGLSPHSGTIYFHLCQFSHRLSGGFLQVLWFVLYLSCQKVRSPGTLISTVSEI